MSVEPLGLLLSLIAGGIGFVLFVYGRKQQRWPQLAAGLLLMVYPYFVSGLWALLGGSLAITAALWYLVSLGY